MNKAYVPINDFVAEFGISRMTVYRMLGTRTLRAVKVGKRTLLDREHAKTWFASLPNAEIKQAA